MTVVYFAVEDETDGPIADRMLRLIRVEPMRTLVAEGTLRKFVDRGVWS